MSAVIMVMLFALTPQQQRGREIYLHGQSITAVVNDEAIPGAVLPCANCHGEDGHGKAEGALRPTDIAPDARPFNREKLKRAITMGIGADRHQLDPAMPRYRMSMRDADDLLAYLKVFAQPGISDDAIRIALVGTPPVSLPSIYNRRIEFVSSFDDVFAIIDTSIDPSATIARAERDQIPAIVVQSREPITSRYAFAMTSTLPAGAESAAARAAIRIALDALAAAGRDVTRSRFIEQLEKTYKRETGVVPPITWNATQHNGDGALSTSSAPPR